MPKKENISVQEWLPFEQILDNGIIKLKNNDYIKIIKVMPINFNLKSELEKEAILNSSIFHLNYSFFCIKKGCPRRSSSVGSLIAAYKISLL